LPPGLIVPPDFRIRRRASRTLIGVIGRRW
jgi:hypothetical protein